MLCRLLPLLLLAGWLRAGTLDKLEQDYNAGRLSAVIERAERLQRAGGSPAERAAACRLAALAHNLRLEYAATNACLTEAVVLDPDHLLNPALLADYSGNLQLRGLQPGTLSELERLQAVSTGRPDLHRFYRRLRAQAEAQQGRLRSADSLLSATGGLGEYWLAGPFANMAASGLRRLEDVEAGLFDTTATWEDQFGLPCQWRRIQSAGGLVDLDMLLGGKPDGCSALLTHVLSPLEQPARLLLSGSGQFRVQVNGAWLLETAEHQAGIDLLYELPVRLAAGWNRILVKACAEQQALQVGLSLVTDAGHPLELEVRATPPGPLVAQLPQGTAPDAVAAWDPGAWLPRLLARTDLPLADEVYLASFLLKRGFLEDGRHCLRRLEARFPSGLASAMTRLDDLNMNLRANEASQLLRTLADQYPELLLARMLQPGRLLEEHDNDGCRRLVQELHSLFPDQSEVILHRGLMLLMDGDTPGGLALMRQGIAREPGCLDLRNSLLEILAALQDEDTRQAEIFALAGARPDWPEGLRWAGGEAFRHDQPEEALRWTAAALAADGRRDIYHRDAALVMQRAGRLDEALEHVNRGLAVSPAMEGLLALKPVLLDKLNRREEALEARLEQARLTTHNYTLQEMIRAARSQPSPFDELPGIRRETLLAESLDWVPTGSPAVYLLDECQYVFQPGGACDRRYRYLVKVLTDAGVKDFMTMNASGSVEVARTIKADGRQIMADIKNGEAAFADLEPGDLVEFQGLSTTLPTAGLPHEYYGSWRFDVGYPVLCSHAVLHFPAGMEPKVQLHNIELEARRGQAAGRPYLEYQTWRRPALLQEFLAPEAHEYGAWLDFSTIREWDRVVRWYQDVISGRLAPSPELRELAGQLDVSQGSDSLRIRRATHWVMENIQYEGEQFVNSGYLPRSIREILRTGYGDCKDQAVLLVGLLRTLGVSASVALVNNSDHMVRSYLPSQRFTHAIVKAVTRDGRVYWIDTTARRLTFPNVPYTLEGQEALVVDGQGAGFERIPLDPLAGLSSRAVLHAVAAADGGLQVRGRIDYTGEEAAWLRDYISREKPETHEALVNGIVSESRPGARFQSFRVQAAGLDEDVSVDFDYALPTAGTSAGSLLLVPLPWSANDVPDDLATLETRRTALDVTHRRGSFDETIELELPAGATLLGEVKAVELKCPSGSYHLRREPAPAGVVRICRHFEITGQRIEPGDYPPFREFLHAAWKAENERLVLQMP